MWPDFGSLKIFRGLLFVILIISVFSRLALQWYWNCGMLPTGEQFKLPLLTPPNRIRSAGLDSGTCIACVKLWKV